MHLAVVMTDNGKMWCHAHRPKGLFLAAWKSDLFFTWTIYAYPIDFPDGFLVRRWTVMPGEAVPTLEAYGCESLEPLQEALIAMGLTRTAFPDPDPHILETWL
jgi:hypothetical protein